MSYSKGLKFLVKLTFKFGFLRINMASNFVVPSLTMKIFHVLPKKYPLKTKIGSKHEKKPNTLLIKIMTYFLFCVCGED